MPFTPEKYGCGRVCEAVGSGAAPPSVGGILGLGAEAVGGTVGLGAEAVGGTAELGADTAGAVMRGAGAVPTVSEGGVTSAGGAWVMAGVAGAKRAARES